MAATQIGQLFSKDTQAILYNYKQKPVQRMLDFDFLCGERRAGSGEEETKARRVASDLAHCCALRAAACGMRSSTAPHCPIGAAFFPHHPRHATPGRKTPSVACIVQPGSSGFQKLFFGSEEIAIPVYAT